jgi:hypothetical protein
VRDLIDRLAWWDLIGFQPTAAQLGPARSNARIRVYCAGRRTGKTLLWGHEDSRVLASGPFTVWIVAPAHELVERVWRVVAADLWRSKDPSRRRDFKPISKREAPGIRRVTFANGAELVGLSAKDPDKSLLGEGVHLLHVTEAARLRRVVYEEFLLPTIMDTRGAAVLDSTPRGDNWFRSSYEDGQAGRNDTESWRMPTWANTVKFPGGMNDPEILKARARMSRDAFRQEIEADFTTFAGRLVPEFVREKHGFHGPTPHAPTRNFGGVDWGWTHPAALLIGGYDGMGRGIGLGDWSASHTRTREIIAQAKALEQTHGPATWFAGTDNPEGIVEFNEAGLECFGAETEHRSGIDCLGALMHPWPDGGYGFEINLDACPNTARALEVAHYREQRGEFGDEFDDELLDPVDAARYLFYSAKCAGEGRTERGDERIELDFL